MLTRRFEEAEEGADDLMTDAAASGCRAYEVCAALVRAQARAATGHATATEVAPLLPGSRLAGLESWWILGDLADTFGVDPWRGEARRQVAQLVAAGPYAVTLERFAQRGSTGRRGPAPTGTPRPVASARSRAPMLCRPRWPCACCAKLEGGDERPDVRKGPSIGDHGGRVKGTEVNPLDASGDADQTAVFALGGEAFGIPGDRLEDALHVPVPGRFSQPRLRSSRATLSFTASG